MQSTFIENLLKEKIGLDPASIGSSSISRVIRSRLSQTGYQDLDKYIKLLKSSEAELRALIEAIVVPETWFFRDRKPFVLLHDYLKEHWLQNKKYEQNMLRILSIPCSTGEEPYSIAMVLSNLEYPKSRYQIDAVDISSEAIAHANEGIYNENSFRGDEMDFRDRYFVREDGGYRLDIKIRKMVNYFQGNLLAGESFSVEGPYNVVFCRNLLIYFDRPDQKRAISWLHQLLATDGILFIGHAEASQILNSQFSALNYLGAFAFHKSNNTDFVYGVQNQGKSKHHNKGVKHEKMPEVTIKPRQPLSSSIVQLSPSLPAEVSDQLGHIKKLADEGQVNEALLLCEKHLQDNPECPAAYYLSGVIFDAAGDMNGATEMFRKAIYLDPNHCEALTRLSLYVERSGNKTASNNLKRRAQRAAERYKASEK